MTCGTRGCWVFWSSLLSSSSSSSSKASNPNVVEGCVEEDEAIVWEFKAEERKTDWGGEEDSDSERMASRRAAELAER
jgi:hypothetical protein